MAEQTHPEMLKVKYPMACDNLEGEMGLECLPTMKGRNELIHPHPPSQQASFFFSRDQAHFTISTLSGGPL